MSDVQNENAVQQQVQAYRNVVQEYEKLDEQIDTLIMKNGGASRNMSEMDRETYKDLARQRRDLFNEMRALEQ
ncbi:MAG: hypothetical protein AAFV33_28555, partial [Chloroflexota bacterium]